MIEDYEDHDDDDDEGAEPLPKRRLHRAGDPRTSVEAARRAAKASLLALQAVERVMSDGRARIDEEIWVDCRASGYISSFDTVRHGRLALSEAKVLIETGATRLTTNNAPSQEWIRDEHWGEIPPAPMPAAAPPPPPVPDEVGQFALDLV